MDDTLDRLRAIMRKASPRSAEAIARATIESDVRRDLGVSSLDMLEVVMEVEESFGIRITDDELRGLRTVGDVVSLVARKPRGAAPA